MRWFAYMNVIILIYACFLCQVYINGGGSERELIGCIKAQHDSGGWKHHFISPEDI